MGFPHLREDTPPVTCGDSPLKEGADSPRPTATSLRRGPVAALTVHRTVIHYRDCASLTLINAGAIGAVHHSKQLDKLEFEEKLSVLSF